MIDSHQTKIGISWFGTDYHNEIDTILIDPALDDVVLDRITPATLYDVYCGHPIAPEEIGQSGCWDRAFDALVGRLGGLEAMQELSDRVRPTTSSICISQVLTYSADGRSNEGAIRLSSATLAQIAAMGMSMEIEINSK